MPLEEADDPFPSSAVEDIALPSSSPPVTAATVTPSTITAITKVAARMEVFLLRLNQEEEEEEEEEDVVSAFVMAMRV
jgi:hypothetical protein